MPGRRTPTGDAAGDACDDDIDDDGHFNRVDNCPLIANVDLLDVDRDGVGDVCDAEQLAVRINEIMAGVNGDSRAQFVEIVTDDPAEKAWGPDDGTVGRVMLAFFDREGEPSGRFVFPRSAPTGGNTVLVATGAFAELTGITPDFVMPELVMPIAGKVCFRGNPAAPDPFAVNLCLSYGGESFRGSTEGAGAANAAELAIMSSRSLSRFASFSGGASQNSSFALATPTPSSTGSSGNAADHERNVVGEIAMPGPGSEAAQGETLFVAETFLGNGRTCASCHLPDEGFGLTPSRVASLPRRRSALRSRAQRERSGRGQHRLCQPRCDAPGATAERFLPGSNLHRKSGR